ncbi:hypothetical protein BMETH_278183677, partial [methanotrophic bacterial endosymbiont of Bathymodiolus sp.]
YRYQLGKKARVCEAYACALVLSGRRD